MDGVDVIPGATLSFLPLFFTSARYCIDIEIDKIDIGKNKRIGGIITKS